MHQSVQLARHRARGLMAWFSLVGSLHIEDAYGSQEPSVADFSKIPPETESKQLVGSGRIRQRRAGLFHWEN